MAASVTVQLHKPNEDGALIAVFMARAHCLAGNARRLLGSEADAEIAFGNTAYFLARSAGFLRPGLLLPGAGGAALGAGAD